MIDTVSDSELLELLAELEADGLMDIVREYEGFLYEYGE